LQLKKNYQNFEKSLSSEKRNKNSSPAEIEGSIFKNSFFFCQKFNGIPTTIANHPNRGEVRIIRWTKDFYFDDPNYTNEKRCLIVAQRLQTAKDKEILNYLVSGIIEGMPALCASKEKPTPTNEFQTCTNEQLLLILEPSQNPQEIIQHIYEINRNRSVNPVEL
jgi:hypothetical protein